MNTFPVLRSCAIRSRKPTVLFRANNAATGLRRSVAGVRSFADDKSSNLREAPPGQSGPNVNPQEHISEEAAKMAKIQGKEGPDLDQGTPVQEIMKGDKEAHEQAPKVLKESIKAGTPPPKPSTSTGSTRSFSTYARRRNDMGQSLTGGEAPIDPSMIPSASQRASYENSAPTAPIATSTTLAKAGHKFPLPDLPLPPRTHKDHRYEPICVQMIGLLTRDGKKSVAHRNLDIILDTLRTSNAPTYNPMRPMLPGAPPASHLPLDPVQYLTLAIDSVAPLLRIRSMRGAAGGGVALQIPVPLNLRQRRRTAMKWVIDGASKRPSTGSGEGQLARRIAQDLISVVEGRSALWDRRNAVHRLATAARSNVVMKRNRR